MLQTNMLDDFSDTEKTNNKKDNPKKSKVKKEPATELMKKVATAVPDMAKIKKEFSPAEVDEIVERITRKEALSNEERNFVTREYREIKRKVKEMEASNNDRLIVYPSLNSGKDWYKVMDFSALYYAYRLADRMGRTAKLLSDTDKVHKGQYNANIRKIDDFVVQMKRFEGSEPEITADGVYIFRLHKALSDDEVGILWHTEETQREKMHNDLRPKAMDATAYVTILTLVLQLMPKIKKLEGGYRQMIGSKMADALMEILSIYFDYSMGVVDKAEAGNQLMHRLDVIGAGLSMLVELRIWGFNPVSAIGGTYVKLKGIVANDFGLKVNK